MGRKLPLTTILHYKNIIFLINTYKIWKFHTNTYIALLLTKKQKKILNRFKENKVNVSKLIREIIFKELTQKKTKKKKLLY